LKFPRRIYTESEVKEAKKLADEGYKYRLRITGTPDFKRKTKQALRLVKTADYYDFLRTYIRSIKEIDGLTQLRQAEATIWTNNYAVENPVDAASIFVQKAHHMKEYLESKLYYGGAAEKRSNEKRIEFLETLKMKTREKKVTKECEKLLNMWRESSLVY
jgi:predicted small secreted protein